MAIVGDFFRHNLTEFLQESPSAAPELHVLAVDDSLVDRKVIERLLKISSCKGDPTLRITSFFFSFAKLRLVLKLCVCVWNGCFSVTVVESGTRALQYLGLDGETSSLGFDVSEFSYLVFGVFFFMLIVEIGWC